ncbi:sigma-70 domain-containing protein [Geminisphaera colitermitum]|uniref:sigma-70 domain-containing protein n=1 Tax=Geminisphaera colitermitum TaxID=1148786 RepID=UPI0018E29606|nr:sigma-70 domain-containing protein [Geminisphaera colitermitum]
MSSLPMALAECLDIVETALATLTRRLPVNVTRDDLASVGKLALIAALGQRQGEPDDVRAYCYVRVRGAMLDELRRLDPLSRRQRDRVGVIARVRTELANRLGRAPTLSEIASATQLTMAEVSSAIDAAAQAADATEIEWDSIPDTQLPSPAEVVELDDVRASLGIALDRLPPNQALALRRYLPGGCHARRDRRRTRRLARACASGPRSRRKEAPHRLRRPRPLAILRQPQPGLILPAAFHHAFSRQTHRPGQDTPPPRT